MPISRTPSAGHLLVPTLAVVLTIIGTPSYAVDPALEAAWRKVAAEVNSNNLKATVAALSSYGSRVSGYPGERAAADFVEKRFRELGLNDVRTETFDVAVPIDKGSATLEFKSARTGGNHSPNKHVANLNSARTPLNSVPLLPLWPNLVRTSQLPLRGVTGPLIYVGDGKLANFNGKDVEGSIVMVDFNSRAEWMNAPRLGAKAVIFIEPDSTMRGEAEAKFISIPISIPRFWLSASQAGPLLAAAADVHPPNCTIHCDMPWEKRKCRNILGKINGTDPKIRDQVIVIEGYYDSMSVVPSLAPGAESACGIAALLELARLFKKYPPGRTIWFVATSGHHLALQGIRELVHNHIDEWAPAGIVETAVSRERAARTGIWLGLFLAVFGVWLFSRLRRPTVEGSRRMNAGSWVLTALVLVTLCLNAGFYASAHDPLRSPPTVYLWTGLDLTSQTRGVGIFYKGWFYDNREDIQNRFSDIARVCRENAEKIGNTLGFDHKKVFADGVNPVDGKNWRNYIPGKPAFDSEVVTMAQGRGFTFASVDDSRAFVDTPFDTPDRVNFANLTFQTKLLACEYFNIVSDTNEPGDINSQRMPITEPSKWSRMALQGGFATLKGRAAIFNPKKTFFAYSDPVLRDTLAVVRSRTKSFMGVRGNMIQPVFDRSPTELNQFEFHGVVPLTASLLNKPAILAAYHLDQRPEFRGEIDYAPDLGVTGAKWIPLDVMVTTATKEVPVVLFRCVPTAIFDLVDQQALKALTKIEVLDGTSDGEPRMYGYAVDPQDPTIVGSYVEDVAVIFSQPGSRLKIMMGSGPGATRLLLINPRYDPSDPFNNKRFADYKPEGKGYLVGGDPKEAQNADVLGEIALEKYDPKVEIARSGAIYNTALHVAEDLWKLDDFRLKRLARYRIVNEGIDELHTLAGESIARAKQAAVEKDWEKFHFESRAAWGFESRAYPDVQRTAVDVIQGVLFYLALLLPFAYFAERLLIGSHELRKQLAYAAAIFIVVFLIFSQVHPAFAITMSPMIVFLAFVMLALSMIVIGLIVGKFEEQLKRINQQISGIHKADIGRVSVALAAFNLGISNMRRRKARTLLTCATLVLLTFTVLSFTSIVQTMRFNQVPAPGIPRYNGLMVRTPLWEQLQEPAYRLLDDEYGKSHIVAPRSWFFGTQIGEQSFLTIKRADKQFDAKALVGLSPQEAKVTHPEQALTAGRWFQPGDTYVVILPDTIATALRVDAQDVGKATVSYAGVDYTVIGLLDTNKLKQITDLDNEIITPVDFILMQRMSRQGQGAGDAGFREYTHLEPDAVFYIPYETATNLGAELRSIAIDFGDPAMVMKMLSPLMHRLALNLYAGRIPADGSRPSIDRYSSLATTSSKGLELVFFPVLIAALIVLNTMLGSVYERVKEIHIFSSIGLSPQHIGMLFMAEAMVYAILGSVAGYLLAQVATSVLVWTGAFEGLYLNFSSVSAVLTTLVVVAVVLLSTLYPARKASEVATPAIDRTWRVPEPEGDRWIIALPFSVTGEQAMGLNQFLSEWLMAYEEYSIGDFVTQGVKTEEFVASDEGDEKRWGEGEITADRQDSAGGGRDVVNQLSTLKSQPSTRAGYRIRCTAWLAPFDLGVSQSVAIETVPTTMEGVYEIRLIIDRESGDISNWKRVNRRFLNTVRKQFLIWRTLKQTEREKYLKGGEDISDAAATGLPVGKMTPQPVE